MRRCLSPSLDKPCKTEGFAGSFPGLSDPVSGKSITGCYNFNFQRISEANDFKCPSDNAPIYLDVRVSRHCGMTDAYTGNKECTTGSYIRVQPYYELQGDPNGDKFRFGHIVFPESVPWVLSATTLLDRMFEICAELKRDKYVWDPTTRTCQKDPKFLCEDPPELGGLGLSWIGGKCVAPDPICPAAKCGGSSSYCSGYLYKPAGEWCYCSGSKTDGKCNIDQITPPGLPQTYGGHEYPRFLQVKCPGCSAVKHETRNGGKCGCACTAPNSAGGNFIWDDVNCIAVCNLSPSSCASGAVDGSCNCVITTTIAPTSLTSSATSTGTSTLDPGSLPVVSSTSTFTTTPGCDAAAKQAECLSIGMSYDNSICGCAPPPSASSTTSTLPTSTTSSTVMPGEPTVFSTSTESTTTTSTTSSISSISTVTVSSTSSTTSTTTSTNSSTSSASSTVGFSSTIASSTTTTVGTVSSTTSSIFTPPPPVSSVNACGFISCQAKSCSKGLKTYPADRCPNGQGSNETFDCCEGGQAKVGQCCEAVGSATITPTSTSTVAPSTAPGNGNGNGNGNGIVSNDFDIEFYLQGPYSFNSR